MQTQHSLSGADLTDEALLTAVREGNIDSFGVLYERYYGMARSIAFRHTTDSARVDDLVSEAFARILQALKNGKGPHAYVGGYLSTTLAHLAGEYGMLASQEVPSEQEHLESMGSLDETVLKLHESDEVITAFTSLPERWQTVLWMTEIESKKPREVAAAMNLSSNAVSALAIRAKESLREGFLRAHQNAPKTQECDRYHSFISPYVRGSLSQKRSDALRSHFETCNFCTSEYLSLVGINKSMRSWIFPVLAGLSLWGTDGAALLSPVALSASATAAAGGIAGGTTSGGSGAVASSQFSILSPVTWGSGAQLVAGTAAVAAATVAVVGGTVLASQQEEPKQVMADGYDLTLPGGTEEVAQAAPLGEEFSPESVAGWGAMDPSVPAAKNESSIGSLGNAVSTQPALGQATAQAGAYYATPAAQNTDKTFSLPQNVETRDAETSDAPSSPGASLGRFATASPTPLVTSASASVTSEWVPLGSEPKRAESSGASVSESSASPADQPSSGAGEDRNAKEVVTASAQATNEVEQPTPQPAEPTANHYALRSADADESATPTPQPSGTPVAEPTASSDANNTGEATAEPTDTGETEYISDEDVPEWYGTPGFFEWFFSVNWDDAFYSPDEVPTNKQCILSYTDWDGTKNQDEVYLPEAALDTIYTNYVLAGLYGVPTVTNVDCD